MKSYFILLIISFTIINYAMTQSTIYNFVVTDINGKPFDFNSLKGKKALIVNVASKCGFTPQYKDLELLYKLYGGNKLEIIGFPANNFMWQEPGSDSEIKQFCTLNYGVSFPIMSKISVKGNDIHAVYQWLTQKSLNGKFDSSVKWNFQKYLINENGTLDTTYASKISPMGSEIIEWVKK